MSMNRQARRMAQKQGLVDESGAAVATKRERPSNAGQRPTEERTKPGEFVKEVRSELRKVKWPTRDEVINYSAIVFVLVVTLTAAIAALDWAFGAGVLALFDRGAA